MPELPSVTRKAQASQGVPPPCYYMGIDPGAKGGAVVLKPDGTVEVFRFKDMQRGEIWEWFRFWGSLKTERIFAVIEKVGGYTRPRRETGQNADGEKTNTAPGHSMFNFGVSYGMLLAFLTAAAIEHEEVPPQRWQKGLYISPREHTKAGRKTVFRESDTAFKNRLKEKARNLFSQERLGGITITHGIADALLIAAYCSRWKEGKL